MTRFSAIAAITIATVAGFGAVSTAHAGYYVYDCVSRWVLGPYGWYLVQYCY